MLTESILSGIKIPENPEDLIREWEKDYEQNGWMTGKFKKRLKIK